ncbi:MAG: hypothetical protein JWN04_5540 [Myxococcaceae bacterium]|nr:hypothetical protein [Myxococcaceae bacterium]
MQTDYLCAMLELRPTCEHCNVALPPESPDARICSFECTFCVTCVEEVLSNVCSNCGGGLVARPVRPATNWNNNNYLGAFPPSSKVKHRPVVAAQHALLVAKLRDVPPHNR